MIEEAGVDERERGRGGRISRSERAGLEDADDGQRKNDGEGCGESDGGVGQHAREASGVISFQCNGALDDIPSEKRLRE